MNRRSFLSLLGAAPVALAAAPLAAAGRLSGTMSAGVAGATLREWKPYAVVWSDEDEWELLPARNADVAWRDWAHRGYEGRWLTDAAPALPPPASQDAGQPVRAGNASDGMPLRGVGGHATGQSEECVAVTGAGEAIAVASDPASGPDGVAALLNDGSFTDRRIPLQADAPARREVAA